MDTLTTTIERKWLSKIVTRQKHIEYRAIKAYWIRRLSRVQIPFELRIINGMQPSAPEVTVVVKRVRKNSRSGNFELSLGEIVSVKNWTMNRRELIDAIENLRAKPPMTVAFQRALERRGILDRSNYTSQKQHWRCWLSEYNGPGFYVRNKWPQSAKVIYNRIVCPPMLLWLGEASGVDESKVAKAKRAALAGGKTFGAQSAAIRKIIPWEEIETALCSGNGSRQSRS
jgi:hypothetical protein